MVVKLQHFYSIKESSLNPFQRSRERRMVTFGSDDRLKSIEDVIKFERTNLNGKIEILSDNDIKNEAQSGIRDLEGAKFEKDSKVGTRLTNSNGAESKAEPFRENFRPKRLKPVRLPEYDYYDYDFIPSMKNLERYYHDYYNKRRKPDRDVYDQNLNQNNGKIWKNLNQIKKLEKELEDATWSMNDYDEFDDVDYDALRRRESIKNKIRLILNKVKNKEKTRTTPARTSTTTTAPAPAFSLSPKLVKNQIFSGLLQNHEFDNFFADYERFHENAKQRFDKNDMRKNVQKFYSGPSAPTHGVRNDFRSGIRNIIGNDARKRFKNGVRVGFKNDVWNNFQNGFRNDLIDDFNFENDVGVDVKIHDLTSKYFVDGDQSRKHSKRDKSKTVTTITTSKTMASKPKVQTATAKKKDASEQKKSKNKSKNGDIGKDNSDKVFHNNSSNNKMLNKSSNNKMLNNSNASNDSKNKSNKEDTNSNKNNTNSNDVDDETEGKLSSAFKAFDMLVKLISDYTATVKQAFGGPDDAEEQVDKFDKDEDDEAETHLDRKKKKEKEIEIEIEKEKEEKENDDYEDVDEDIDDNFKRKTEKDRKRVVDRNREYDETYDYEEEDEDMENKLVKYKKTVEQATRKLDFQPPALLSHLFGKIPIVQLHPQPPFPIVPFKSSYSAKPTTYHARKRIPPPPPRPLPYSTTTMSPFYANFYAEMLDENSMDDDHLSRLMQKLESGNKKNAKNRRKSKRRKETRKSRY